MEHIYFEEATQVAYWECIGGQWLGGIAYKDFVICGCCGGVIKIKEIYDFAPEHIGNPIRLYDNWENISNEILS